MFVCKLYRFERNKCYKPMHVYVPAYIMYICSYRLFKSLKLKNSLTLDKDYYLQRFFIVIA